MPPSTNASNASGVIVPAIRAGYAIAQRSALEFPALAVVLPVAVPAGGSAAIKHASRIATDAA